MLWELFQSIFLFGFIKSQNILWIRLDFYRNAFYAMKNFYQGDRL